jgi:hypothetical protein
MLGREDVPGNDNQLSRRQAELVVLSSHVVIFIPVAYVLRALTTTLF